MKPGRNGFSWQSRAGLLSLKISVGVPSFRHGCRIPASKDGKLGLQKVSFYPWMRNYGLASRLNKHLPNRLATVHGLDFGIHAEMTAFWALLKQLANRLDFIRKH